MRPRGTRTAGRGRPVTGPRMIQDQSSYCSHVLASAAGSGCTGWSDKGPDSPEDRMDGWPAGLRTILDAPDCAQGGDPRSGARMLDGRDGPARLVFESDATWPHAARLDRWLAIVWDQPPPRGASRVIWMLDASTVRWSGGRPPGELDRGMTGLDAEEAPILWFRASGGIDRRRGFTASGVFGAAGIVDAARVHVTARRTRRQTRLRMSIDTRMWGLSARPACRGIAPGAALTITAFSALRPLEPQAIGQWL
jgi:hypothetical protein